MLIGFNYILYLDRFIQIRVLVTKAINVLLLAFKFKTASK